MNLFTRAYLRIYLQFLRWRVRIEERKYKERKQHIDFAESAASLFDASIIYTRLEDEMSITFPVKLVRERLSEEEIKDFFEGLMPIINRSLQEKLASHKCQLSEHVYIYTESEEKPLAES